jgi:HK97 family phage portal protein
MNIAQHAARLFGFTSTNTLEIRKASASADRPVPAASSGQYGKPVAINWNTGKAIRDGLKASGIVYACVTRIATAASTVPIIIEKLDADGNWQRQRGHPLETLIAQPNAHMSGQDLLEITAHHLLLGGNGLWQIVNARGKPAELWPIMPDTARPIPSADLWLAGYEFKLGSTKTMLEPNQVVHHMLTDPSNFYWGLGPLQAAAKALETDGAAGDYSRDALTKRMRLAGMFSFKNPLSKDQHENAVGAVDKFVAEGRQYLTLGSDADFKTLNTGDARGMQVLEGRKFTREEICAVFAVPPVLVASQDASTYNNTQTAIRMLYEFAVLPLLENVCQTITLKLCVAYGARGTLRARADLTGVGALRENMLDKGRTAETFSRAGFSLESINARLELGLEVNEVAPPSKAGPAPKETRTLDDAARAAHWKRLNRARIVLETVIETRVATQFKREASAVLTALETSSQAALGAINRDAWEAMLTTVYAETIRSFATLTGIDLEQQTKHGPEPGENKRWTFSSTGRLKAWIKATAAEMITNIVTTTRTAIKDQIAQALEANETSIDLAKRIRNLYDVWEGSTLDTPRALLIARTEVGRAANYGTLEGSLQVSESLGVQTTKSWITSRDARVRDEHKALDGETVGANERFSNGLEYPSDPNCRCVMAFQILK